MGCPTDVVLRAGPRALGSKAGCLLGGGEGSSDFVLRRRDGRASSQIIHGAIVLDPITHTVQLRDVAIPVTAREFTLLRALMERPGAVLSRTQIEERLYGWEDTVQSNAIEFTIHGLRKKFGNGVIENVRGVGWRIGLVP